MDCRNQGALQETRKQAFIGDFGEGVAQGTGERETGFKDWVGLVGGD